MFKKFIRSKAGKVWIIVSACLIALIVVVNALLSTLFYIIVSLVLGRGAPVYADGVVSMYPATESTSKAEATQNAHKKNIELCEEGFVLLKNENDALPMRSGGKVSVFGKNSVNLSYGGSGSGGFDASGNKTLYDSLHAAGFSTNPVLENFYKDDSRSGAKRAANSSDLDSGGNQKISTAETPQNSYTDDIKNSYSEYSDAAIVVITRIGGEGFDLPRYQGDTAGAANPDDHYLQLDKNETDLLKAVCAGNFKRVIVIFNIPSSFEATFLTDPDYAAFANDIDAAVWTGFTGAQGIMALGEVLNGEVNPSGKLVDTWASDFSADPSFVNFGTGPTPDDSDKYDAGLYYFVDYEESVYVGYRYYETRGVTDGENWYKDAVVYPFGYGLSYTEFQWTLKDASQIDGKSLSQADADADAKYTVTVNVKNTGNVAGKEVVQLYAHAPYINGEIEKADRILVDFAKTGLLQPGEDEDVTLTFDPYLLASYDYKDANKNGASTFELDGAEGYKLYINRDAHTIEDEVGFAVNGDIVYAKDPVTDYTVQNRFTDQENEFLNSDLQLSTVLSRSNWAKTWPDVPSDAERAASTGLIDAIKDTNHNNPNDYSNEAYPLFGQSATISMRDMLPLETPEASYLPIIDYDDERWEQILSACNASELINLYNYGAYGTQAVSSIGLPATLEGDGPAGFTCFMNKTDFAGTCNYCSEPVMAATWNVELIEEMGKALGEEGIWGSPDTGTPYSGIYAPGVNIHRSPFGGRNSEYFSEDPVITGKMAAAEIKGCQSKGVFCTLKHFAANEQETHRSINGDCSYLTEQSLREIYLRPFEIAVKDGGSRGVMTSFNRIGTRWTGGDYRLVTEILRNEWGFKGLVICDFNTIPQYMNSRQMAYAGGDINLVAYNPVEWCDPSETGDAIMLRQSAKNIFYTLINSNAMNGEVLYYKLPVWQIMMYVIDAVLFVGIAVWGVLAFFKVNRKTANSGMTDKTE